MVAIRESGSTLLATYEYDQLGRRDRLVLGNGAVTDYQYDDASRLWKLTHDPAGTAHDNEITLTYNPAGQIVGRVATNNAYAWTGHGNGSTTASFDGLNRPVGDSHDARSNRTSDGTRTYVFDSENKARGTATAPWHYDPVGRLSGVSTTPGTPPVLAYESYVDNLIAERTPGSSTVGRRHVFGPGVDEPLVWYEGSGTTDRRFLQADERGSIVAVSDGSGAVQNVTRLDEYGRLQNTNPYWQSRFAFTGQRYFGGFGLYHYKNRTYDPRVGRFMQPDPIGYGDGMNLYAYVGGDPINSTDPSGLANFGGCTGTRICHHDSGGGGSAQVFADIGGYRGGGGGSGGGGKDTSNNPDKGGFKNIAIDLRQPIQLADASGWVKVLEGAETAGKWTLRGVGGIATAACFLLSGACGLEEQRMSLFRVVDSTELRVIQTTGTYGFNASGSGKYFGFSKSQTENLFNTVYKASGGSLTETSLPMKIIYQGYEFNDPGGAGPSIHFSDPQLPMVYQNMSPIRVIYTKVPR